MKKHIIDEITITSDSEIKLNQAISKRESEGWTFVPPLVVIPNEYTSNIQAQVKATGKFYLTFERDSEYSCLEDLPQS